MNFDDMYGSKYLKGSDLQYGKFYRLTITQVDFEKQKNRESGEEEWQAVLSFGQTKKVLGVTNANAQRIQEYYTKDFNHWLGQDLIIRLENVSAFGEQHDVPRVLPLRENPNHTPNRPLEADSAPLPRPANTGEAASSHSHGTTSTPSPGAPDSAPPQSVEQGVHQAQAPAAAAPDPLSDVGQPLADGEVLDYFDDDVPF